MFFVLKKMFAKNIVTNCLTMKYLRCIINEENDFNKHRGAKCKHFGHREQP